MRGHFVIPSACIGLLIVPSELIDALHGLPSISFVRFGRGVSLARFRPVETVLLAALPDTNPVLSTPIPLPVPYAFRSPDI